MSILGRTRTRSTGHSPAAKAKAKAPLQLTSSHGSTTISNTSAHGPARLTIAGIANIFIKLRHLERQSKNPYTTACTSGDEPLSHPRVQQGVLTEARAPVSREDTFVCAGNGGVNVLQLLRATRCSLMKQAKEIGANALVDEHWECVINEPKHRPRGQYKIHVQYSASATQSSNCDTLQPVAIDKITGVPGLMTIIRRNDD